MSCIGLIIFSVVIVALTVAFLAAAEIIADIIFG